MTIKSKEANKPITQVLKEHHERIEREQPIIRSRFYIMEVTPSRRYSDEYSGGWTQERKVKVSPYFNTKEEAWAWAKNYEPDDGKVFKCVKENLRQQPPLWVGY